MFCQVPPEKGDDTETGSRSGRQARIDESRSDTIVEACSGLRDRSSGHQVFGQSAYQSDPVQYPIHEGKRISKVARVVGHVL